jgi:hypothetical protein
MPTIQAQDIVNAVIQDSQNQTTNRTALYDYVDRIHQRILRESQWRFLLSDPQTFVTMPGVSSYTLVSGTPPAGSFQTPLGLTDFNNIAPGSVFDLSTWTKIEEDSDTSTSLNYILNRDGSLRHGQPRTYINSLSNPGTISLMPTPDAQNVYYPVPETPAVSYAALPGCTLPERTYYGIVTFVDSLGGESTQCITPIAITVPAGSVVTVQSPNPSPGGINGAQVGYSCWNLYLGYALGYYFIQNVNPLNIGTGWTETAAGLYRGTFLVPSLESIPYNTVLSISSTGFLSTTTYPTASTPPYPYALVDANGIWWEIIATPALTTQQISQSTGIKAVSAIYLTDTSNVSTWSITVTTGGTLQATAVSTPPSSVYFYQIPPVHPTIQPLNAYVIQFRYYRMRNPIANPTDVLQIPYMYKDIVIAGVNYLANLYMNRNDGVQPSAKSNIWKRDFEQGLTQIRRDLRINYRKTDYISPDPASQYVVGNQQGIPTMGW